MPKSQKVVAKEWRRLGLSGHRNNGTRWRGVEVKFVRRTYSRRAHTARIRVTATKKAGYTWAATNEASNNGQDGQITDRLCGKVSVGFPDTYGDSWGHGQNGHFTIFI